MKRFIKFLVLLLLALIIVLTIVNQFMERTLETEISIDAPAEEVWEALLDYEDYPNWNPFIKKISGSTTIGENLAVTIQSEGNDPMDFEPVVLANEKNKEFRWKGKLLMPGIFDGEHYFLLESIGFNRTKFVHGENFTGVLSGIFMKMIGEDTKNGFNSMNQALKLKVEKKD